MRDAVKGADVVVHLAFTVVQASDASYAINVDGSRNVFEAAVAEGPSASVTRRASRRTGSTTTTPTG